MTLHLVKLSVGSDDIDDIARFQKKRMRESKALWHFTRHGPKREEDLVGGSIYWVVRGTIRVRQKLLGFERHLDEEGQSYCRIMLDPALVRTEPKGMKAFQGWRYLAAKDAPRDLAAGVTHDGDELPEAIVEELRALGLW